MKIKTLQTIKKHSLIDEGMHIVVGLSGGPDSVCLFDVLRDLQEDMNLKLYAVHVNHKLRPGAAEEDQRYVEELCNNSNVPCFVFVEDCNAVAKSKGLTSEEAGRILRYEAFGKVATDIHNSGVPKEKIAIALAHNANDQCETILFRLMRGTGTDGLAGIPYKRYDENGFKIVRPILDLKRTEIEEYCSDRHLSPQIDHTNNENLYARNRIRNLLIPFMEENFNENLVDTVNRLGLIASGDREYLKEQAEDAYNKALVQEVKPKVILDCEALSNLHSAIRFRVYTIALETLGMAQNLTFAQGEGVDKVLMSDSPSAMNDLSEGFRVYRQYENIVFENYNLTKEKNSNKDSGWSFKTFTKEEFEAYKKEKALDAQEGKLAVYGAFPGVNQKDVMIRTRKAGDIINTGNGTKKIQDFFVDQKVPKLLRDELLLLAKGSNILWVLPNEEFLSENMKEKGRFSADFKGKGQEEDTVLVLEKLL